MLKNIILSLAMIALTIPTFANEEKKHESSPADGAIVTEKAHTEAAPEKNHDTHHAPKGVVPDTAIKWLKNGNTRYTKNKLRKDGQSISDIERLSKGQAPHTIILSCSDSRVPPEVVFDQKLGEIFVVRTAGEVIEPSAIGSIEYAIEHLGTKLIVVMGHTSCGAVKAALSTLSGADAGSPNLNKLVADIHPRLMSYKDKTPSSDVKEESWVNAKGVAKDLLERSKIISEKANSGDIKIKVALYNLNSGIVDWE